MNLTFFKIDPVAKKNVYSPLNIKKKYRKDIISHTLTYVLETLLEEI